MDDELTPQETERVRRLLAEARHDEPVPADVAARIDRVLGDLAAERDSAPGGPETADAPRTDGAGVVRLDERRRQVGRMLLVAAAVVVGGVTVGQVVDGSLVGGSGDSESTGADNAAHDEALPAPHRGGEEQDEDEAPAAGEAAPGAVSAHRRSISRQPAQEVRSEQFARDAARLQAVAAGRRTAEDSSVRLHAGAGSCEPGAWGGGRYLRVTFDDEGGWLVFRPPRGDTQVVDLFLCGEDAAERSTTLSPR